LIDLRQAQVIKIADANTFFRVVAEKVFSLRDISKPHPLSAKVAVASLKKYIVDQSQRIRLYDLVMNETEKVYAELIDENFPVQNVAFSKEELFKRVQRYEALSEILHALIINGCYWGEKEHEAVWVKCLERIANPPGRRDGLQVWLKLRSYPALLLLYGGGIAAIAAKKYETFSALLTKAVIRDGNNEHPLVLFLYNSAVIESAFGNQLPGMDRRHTPLSDYLFNVLRHPLREILSDDLQYQKCFDRFEYLLSLVHVDLREKRTGRTWGPLGPFAWRYHLDLEGSVMNEIEKEINVAGNKWPLLVFGHFDGTIERLKFVKLQLDKIVAETHWT
jgi:hypothetical protein